MVAGLYLHLDILTAIVKEIGMPVDISDSSIIQYYVTKSLAEGRAEGRTRGRAKGLATPSRPC